MRPLMPDGLPVIGPAPRLENLFVATGHGMLGITLAPATARVIADLIGGGAAGTVASIAAAREGARVACVERYGFLGGTLTAAMVAPMMGFHAGEQQVVRGIPQEIVDRLIALGASPGHVPDPIDFCYTVTPFAYEGL